MFTSLTRWMKAHELLAFFVLTFVISWGTWAYVILTLPELDMKYLGSGGMLLMLLGQWGPAVSAVLVAAITRGKPGLNELFGKLKYRRGTGRWLFVGFCLWTAIYLVATMWHARATNQALNFQWNQWTRIFSLIISAVPLFFWGCEEIGWRGFAQPRLLGRWNALAASVILGLLWSAWHLPMFTGIKGLTPDMPFYTFLVYTVSISVIMTWLLNHTQGSLLVAIFVHFWFNQWVRYLSALLPVEDPGGSVFVTSTWLLAGIAALVVVVYGYRRFNRNLERSAPAELITSQA